MTQLEKDYIKLWHIVRRIELNQHEDGKPMETDFPRELAKFALNRVELPSKVLAGYERIA